MFTYCIFCRSGSENSIADKVATTITRTSDEPAEFKLIVPMRTITERRDGKWREVKHAIFPGYIFLYSENPFSNRIFSSITNYYRMLTNPDGSHELNGSDAEVAGWFYRNDGVIEVSNVAMVGKSIRVISGPLADVVGTIESIDRRKRRVSVRTDFAGKSGLITMGINIIEIAE
jgi:transcriptional antiterminator NusG